MRAQLLITPRKPAPRNNMSMLSTFQSRKATHEDTQKFDENEVYKMSRPKVCG